MLHFLRHVNDSWGNDNDANCHKQTCVMPVKIVGDVDCIQVGIYVEFHPSKLAVTRDREPGAHFFQGFFSSSFSSLIYMHLSQPHTCKGLPALRKAVQSIAPDYEAMRRARAKQREHFKMVQAYMLSRHSSDQGFCFGLRPAPAS